MEVNYIWLDYIASTGSFQSKLIWNGRCSEEESLEQMKRINLDMVIKSTPKWMDKCTRIEVTAQNLKTSTTLIKKVIYENI